MEKSFKEMFIKWSHKTKKYDYKNQPYNFTYKEFTRLNPVQK